MQLTAREIEPDFVGVKETMLDSWTYNVRLVTRIYPNKTYITYPTVWTTILSTKAFTPQLSRNASQKSRQRLQ